MVLTSAQGILYNILKINAEVQMERIRQLRNERGLSQVKLAVMADMDPATLNRLERGTGNPNLNTLERVAGALGVEVTDFFPKAQSPLPLEDAAAGTSMLEAVLDAARRDKKKNAHALNRLAASEGVPQSGINFAEDEVRAELRNLGFSDAFFEDLLWPLAERVIELEGQLEAKEREPAERLGTDKRVRQ
jgi:transcriptional regulator with XRE-family HTH domain